MLAASQANRRFFHLALPSIISELTTPLLGIVDTVVAGHLADARDLSGTALATAAYTPLLMVFNFLRMGTGATTAQAFGAQNAHELLAGVARGICVAALIGIVLCSLQQPLMMLSFTFIHAPDPGTLDRALAYYRMRILGVPAALSNFVVQAWLIGVQRTDQALATNLVLNLCKAFLCILFGWGLDFGVAGIGAATAIASYLALAFGIYQIWRVSQQLPWLTDDKRAIDWALVFEKRKLVELASLNLNIFLRSICMMFIVTDFTSLSAKLGTTALAANNLLMQMQMLISFGADGFANAAEAMIGESVGLGRSSQVRIVFTASLRCDAVLGLGFTFVYWLFGRLVLGALTSHIEVVSYAAVYLPWQWIAPLLSVTAYLMDGVFVGATRPREMRNATFLALAVFIIVGHSYRGSNNVLWLAYLLHVIVRAVALLCWYPRIEHAVDLAGKQPLLESAGMAQ